VSAAGAIHRDAATGFGRAADAYERGRPSYPMGAVALLVRELAIGRGTRVVDLAAGTGKLTRLLEASGADLVAIEPVAAMRELLVTAAPGATIVDGTAERMPLNDASVDAVIVAQAFHWFEPSLAAREIVRVLKPRGGLGLIWNVRDESVPWVHELTRIMDPYRGATPSHASVAWRPPLEASGLFDPLRERTFRHEQTTSPDEVVDRIASVSFIAALPQDERAAVASAVRATLEADPNTRGRDSLVFPYRTVVFWTRRREAQASAVST
jgi:SAM-dependent methyltransferase